MAENISELKALGGGDFTSLAAWLAWAEVSGVKGETAECYDDGGSLGDMVATTVWAAGTHDASNRCIVRAATGHGHGADPTAGAVMGTVSNQKLNYFELTGMRGSRFDVGCPDLSLTGCKYYNNLIGWPAHPLNYTHVRLWSSNDAGTGHAQLTNCEIVNNIFVGQGAAGKIIRIDTWAEWATYYSRITGLVFDNNLVIGDGTNAVNCISTEIVQKDTYIFSAPNIVFSSFKNNILLNATSSALEITKTQTGNITNYGQVTIPVVNCAADDASLTGHSSPAPVDSLENQTIADLITDWANDDFELVRNGPAHDAGYDTGQLTDMLGRSRVGDYDMGPLELQPASESAIESKEIAKKLLSLSSGWN